MIATLRRVNELAGQLDPDLPDGMDVLTDAELADLASLVATAKRQQAAACDKAIDDGLAKLPKFMRPAVKRALF